MDRPVTVLYVGPDGAPPLGDPTPTNESGSAADAAAGHSGSELGDATASSGARLDVREADDGQTALERLSTEAVDCVVVEHRPPALDALAVADSVRDREDAVPVLVVTRDGSATVARDALAAGVADVIQTAPSALTAAALSRRVGRVLGDGRTDAETERPADRTRASASDGGAPGRAANREAAGSRTPSGRYGADADPGAETTGPGGNGERSRTAGPDRSRGEVPRGLPTSGDGDSIRRLGDATALITGAETREAVATAVRDVAPGLLGVDGVGVFLLDDEANRLRPAAVTDSLVDYYGGELEFGPGRPDSITWGAFVDGEPRIVEDVGAVDGRVNETTDARGAAFVPLGDHGVLVAAADEAGAFSGDRGDVVGLLGDVTESALERAALRRAVDERDERLRDARRRLDGRERVGTLVRSLLRTLAAADSRPAIERAVCELFVEDDRIAFAWIGDRDRESGALEPRQWAGAGSRYLDGPSSSIRESDEPTARAARTDEVVVADNVADTLRAEGWERAALASDFHAAAAVPLVHDGVRYGVLGVYGDRPGAFEGLAEAALADVGGAVGFAINAAESRAAAAATTVSEVELRVEAPGDPLNALARAVGGRIECLDLATNREGGTDVLLSAPDAAPEAVRDAAADLLSVRDLTQVGGADAPRFRATVTADVLPSVLAGLGAKPTEATADGDDYVLTVAVPAPLSPGTFVSRLEQLYPSTELLALREGRRPARTRVGFRNELEAVLTDRQLEVLRTAHEMGFFESPRRATGGDVADELDVSQPTISHHLREGQGRLFSLLFDED